jgi:hypothetical protein
MRGIRRRALALTMLVAFGAPSGALAATPGVDADLTWNIPADTIARETALMQQAGVKTVRLSVEWSAIERDASGTINTGWVATIDSAIASAQAAGLDVLVTLGGGTPYWASSDPAKYRDGAGTHWNKAYPPANSADYGRFAGWAAAHWGAQGVHAFELWNEPNLPHFWAPSPDAARFASLLKAAYPQVKAADPSATVVMGGPSQNDYRFLEGVYAAGGGGSFDVLGTHTYPDDDPDKCWNEGGRPAQGALCSLDELRNVMTANGDGAKNIWITEMGFSTYSGSGGLTAAQQADYLTKTYKQLEARPWVQRAYWYNFRDTYWLKEDPSNWDANLGLIRADLTPTPAYAAYQAYATAQTPIAGDPPSGQAPGQSAEPQATGRASAAGKRSPAKAKAAVNSAAKKRSTRARRLAARARARRLRAARSRWWAHKSWSAPNVPLGLKHSA